MDPKPSETIDKRIRPITSPAVIPKNERCSTNFSVSHKAMRFLKRYHSSCKQNFLLRDSVEWFIDLLQTDDACYDRDDLLRQRIAFFTSINMSHITGNLNLANMLTKITPRKLQGTRIVNPFWHCMEKLLGIRRNGNLLVKRYGRMALIWKKWNLEFASYIMVRSRYIKLLRKEIQDANQICNTLRQLAIFGIFKKVLQKIRGAIFHRNNLEFQLRDEFLFKQLQLFAVRDEINMIGKCSLLPYRYEEKCVDIPDLEILNTIVKCQINDLFVMLCNRALLFSASEKDQVAIANDLQNLFKAIRKLDYDQFISSKSKLPLFVSELIPDYLFHLCRTSEIVRMQSFLIGYNLPYYRYERMGKKIISTTVIFTTLAALACISDKEKKIIRAFKAFMNVLEGALKNILEELRNCAGPFGELSYRLSKVQVRQDIAECASDLKEIVKNMQNTSMPKGIFIWVAKFSFKRKFIDLMPDAFYQLYAVLMKFENSFMDCKKDINDTIELSQRNLTVLINHLDSKDQANKNVLGELEAKDIKNSISKLKDQTNALYEKASNGFKKLLTDCKMINPDLPYNKNKLYPFVICKFLESYQRVRVDNIAMLYYQTQGHQRRARYYLEEFLTKQGKSYKDYCYNLAINSKEDIPHFLVWAQDALQASKPSKSLVKNILAELDFSAYSKASKEIFDTMNHPESTNVEEVLRIMIQESYGVLEVVEKEELQREIKKAMDTNTGYLAKLERELNLMSKFRNELQAMVKSHKSAAQKTLVTEA